MEVRGGVKWQIKANGQKSAAITVGRVATTAPIEFASLIRNPISL